MYCPNSRRGDATPALVLLHGAASNSTRWWQFVEGTRLRSGGWKLLTPTLRGNGDAVFPRTRLGIDVWCGDILRLLDDADCERVVLGGHCLGANVALHFAARHPQRVSALVLIEPMKRQAFRGSMARLAALRPLLEASYGIARAMNSLGIYRRRLPPLDLREWDRTVRSGAVQLPCSRRSGRT